MRILAVTNMYPTSEHPTSGTFVEQQIKSLRASGVDVEVMLVDRIVKGMRAYYGLGKQLASTIARFQPDLVHTMYGGVMAYQVVRAIHDRPTIVTFHGSDLLGENLCGPVRKVVSGFGIRASRAASRRVTGIITVSQALSDTLPDDVDRRKVRIIPCGIDLDLFKPLDKKRCQQTLGWKPDTFHVLFPANNGDPVKRPELAKAAIEALIQSGMPAELHYLRGVPYQRVAQWLNASDSLLLTSLHEGSPTVVKEALACNVPVVSVNVGDVSERIQGVENCYIAEAEPSDLADKLRLILSSGRELGGGRHSIQQLSLASIAHTLQEFYRSTINAYRNALRA